MEHGVAVSAAPLRPILGTELRNSDQNKGWDQDVTMGLIGLERSSSFGRVNVGFSVLAFQHCGCFGITDHGVCGGIEFQAATEHH
jgi:hypothetical protein